MDNAVIGAQPPLLPVLPAAGNAHQVPPPLPLELSRRQGSNRRVRG